MRLLNHRIDRLQRRHDVRNFVLVVRRIVVVENVAFTHLFFSLSLSRHVKVGGRRVSAKKSTARILKTRSSSERASERVSVYSTQRREEKRPFLLRLLFFFEGEGKFLKFFPLFSHSFFFPFFFPILFSSHFFFPQKKKEKITTEKNKRVVQHVQFKHERESHKSGVFDSTAAARWTTRTSLGGRRERRKRKSS